MTDVLSRLAGPAAFNAGTTTILTVTAAHTYTVRNITIVNEGVSSVNVKLGINGIADANLILPLSPIDAKGMAQYSGVLMLLTTDTLQINTDGTVTVTVNGLDQS